jgi:dTDP-4-dehydrorhamnose 3,5-epimerase
MDTPERIKKTDLKIILSEDGSVMHSLKSSEKDFKGFGESYFSTVNNGAIKAWKRHKKMTLNLTVPVGIVRFVFIYDLNIDIDLPSNCEEYMVSSDSYVRLTVPPNIWFGFQGMSLKTNLIANIANIEHDPDEVERKSINEIEYNWFK